MLCAELEQLEGKLDDIITELEKPDLPPEERRHLEEAYSRLSRDITAHHKAGHGGGPCFEDDDDVA